MPELEGHTNEIREYLQGSFAERELHRQGILWAYELYVYRFYVYVYIYIYVNIYMYVYLYMYIYMYVY